MSKMSDLAIEVEELLEQGFEPEDVARILSIPYNWVIDIVYNDDLSE